MAPRPLSRDDRELLVAARTDPDAFGAFYDRHADGLLRHFRRRGLQTDLALDLVAETFAAALESLERYAPGPEPAAAWLYGIGHHVLASSARRGRIGDDARRRMHVPRLSVTDLGIAAIDDRADSGDDPLLLALAELPDDHRQAVWARIVDDRDYADIATDMRCSEHLVRQRVSRGLRRLRDVLQGDHA
ncbi:RNA polymerase sigma factor [Patulibacter sp. NPDC049589]|uniref:RNA polymerase sigma factor n=1 Tax=Patulibacter sp. NPDC049589 TaxID=3154731 RepID=UPI00342AC1EB